MNKFMRFFVLALLALTLLFITNLNAVVLTQQCIRVENLNGTNGITIINFGIGSANNAEFRVSDVIESIRTNFPC